MTPAGASPLTDSHTLLHAALTHVPFEGWSDAALHRAADELHVPRAEMRRMFPGGAVDALDAFARQCDAQMLARYAEHMTEGMRIRDKIALLVRLRLEAYAPHREAARKAVAFYALPIYAHRGIKSAARTVDAMWQAAGDNATDHNWYSKRFLLGGVYATTLLFWLNDQSPRYAASWEFLARRIDNVMAIQKLKMRKKKI